MKYVGTTTPSVYPHVAGIAGEQAKASLFEDGTFGITFYNVGDLTEEAISQKFSTATIDGNVIEVAPMTHRGNASATKSGSDWILTNSKGYTIRA
jgi:hypothetical protein